MGSNLVLLISQADRLLRSTRSQRDCVDVDSKVLFPSGITHMATAAVTNWLVHYQQCSNSQVRQVIIYLLRLKNVTGTGLDN